MSKGEQKIINQIKNGDVSAYAKLVYTYQSMAFTLALSITKNTQDAEEVAQDAFVKAYKKLDTFKGKSKFSTWLYQIIYRTALSKVRLKKPNWQSLDEQTDKNYNLDSGEAEPLESIDRKKILKLALSKLNEDESFLLILYYYQEQSIEEITDITNLSESNVKVKLFRARKNLNLHLQKIMRGEAQTLIQN